MIPWNRLFIRASLRLATSVLLSTTALSAASAAAPPDWPTHPIRIVVPFGAGAMGDTLARLLAPALQQSLGTPVIVDNRPGAGGNIGANAVASAPADGYTLLMAATNNLVLNQFLYRNLAFDPLAAFDPVVMVADVPGVLYVNGKLPANSMAELLQLVRSQPGRFNYGSPGPGTTPHLSTQALVRAQGLDMVHVPYGGAGQAVQALLAGDVHVYLGGAGLGAAHLEGGRLKALAVAHDQRLAALPQVPTFAEAGVAELLANNWWALAAPAGTPPEVVEKLNSAVGQALENTELRQRLEGLGAVPVGGSPADMRAILTRDAQFWQQAVQSAGVVLE